VSEMNKLRTQARQLGVHVQVVRNTLARLAVAETPFECVAEVLKGPVMLAFALDEPGSAAKLVKDFMKDHQVVQVDGLSMGQELLGPESLAMIAKLPTREEALAMLARVLIAPVVALAKCHNDVVGRLVRVTSQVAER
jgi:large subunit ribosomal protein L10